MIKVFQLTISFYIQPDTLHIDIKITIEKKQQKWIPKLIIDKNPS